MSRRALRELRSAVRGRVLVPRDSTADRLQPALRGPSARTRWCTRESTADVAAAVRWANRFDVRLVARSGGHSYAGYSTHLGRGRARPVARCSGVRVSSGRATIGPAAQLIDVQRALTRRGLTVPSGSCPSVGIGGLALGGGHGLAGRRFGLTSDNLVAARVVTADGRVRHVDADTNEDLYWACRGGGGGNFGVVTSLTLRTHRASRRVVVQRVLAVVAGRARRSRPGSASRPRRRPRSPRSSRSAPPAARARRAWPRSGSTSASEAALRRLFRPLTRVAGASLSSGSSSYFSLVLRWAGCLDGGLAACHRSTRSSFFAKSDYFDRRLGPRGRAIMIDWIERRQRNPSLGLRRAAARRLRRSAQPAGRRRHRVRPPRHAVLAPVPRLLQRRHGRAGEPALDQRRVAGAAAARLRRGVPELHRPASSTTGSARTTARTSSACARSRSRWTPTSAFASGRRYRRRADGPRLAAGGCARSPATSGSSPRPRSRASRTRCSRSAWSCWCSTAPTAPALAGATVAAITFPSLVSGPLLGAWLDLTGPAPHADGDRPARDRVACSWRSCCSSGTRRTG